ncbi:unnamed protein product, partial [Ectocarpus sp. 4 AP-2014]
VDGVLVNPRRTTTTQAGKTPAHLLDLVRNREPCPAPLLQNAENLQNEAQIVLRPHPRRRKPLAVMPQADDEKIERSTRKS